jgi:hypothetical protein
MKNFDIKRLAKQDESEIFATLYAIGKEDDSFYCPDGIDWLEHFGYIEDREGELCLTTKGWQAFELLDTRRGAELIFG